MAISDPKAGWFEPVLDNFEAVLSSSMNSGLH
jgi:hypothetical protein